MQSLQIGQWVETNAVSSMQYDEAGRRYVHRSVCIPFRGVIVGKAVKQLGQYKHGQAGSIFGDDYEPASLKVTGTVTLWLVLVGWLNKPMLVGDADLTPTEAGLLPRCGPRVKYPPIPDYDECLSLESLKITGYLTHEAAASSLATK